MNLVYLHFIKYIMQTMERLRSQETGIFKKKPADLMQIFKVRQFFLQVLMIFNYFCFRMNRGCYYNEFHKKHK